MVLIPATRVDRPVFHLVLIKPTHYGDDGYPIRWFRAAIPSNTLACLNSLAEDARQRQVLGPGIEIRLHTFDETNRRVDPRRIIRAIRRAGGRALVGMVGVQSNQFPRAMDLARPFRAAGLPVCIGGFHVSGCIAMLPAAPPEMVEARALGISFFAGEAEGGRLDAVLRDAWNGALQPIYNYMNDLPTIEAEPLPILPRRHIRRIAHSFSSFDLGRGCPYQCSFCTIINVQGRKSRFRTPDDLERAIRANYAQGIRRFFITDDNFARNRNWEALFDRMIRLRRQDGIRLNLMIQVDTLCHRIPNFIEKAAQAGVRRVFIGLENINPDNLIGAKKHQNKITDYRVMLQKWREHGMITYAGYITGFPSDTKQSILRDIEIIKRELPLDLLELFYLTPLPGSEDHLNLWRDHTWMDPDLNKYDLSHRVTHHPRMADREWEETYRAAWESFYSYDHIRTILRRAAANPNGRPRTIVIALVWFKLAVLFEGVHPLESGAFRRRARRERRPELPRESRLSFYPRRAAEIAGKARDYWRVWRRMQAILKEVLNAPDRATYTDLSIQPPADDEFDRLDLYQLTSGGTAALARKRRDDRLRAKVG
ncbi:MAG: radical SAM protein [Alphaproteobacteria bacterium]|nr:radical SAM protein [Alphaproteobacteria bacterium]